MQVQILLILVTHAIFQLTQRKFHHYILVLEINRYGFLGANTDTDISAIHGPRADNQYF